MNNIKLYTFLGCLFLLSALANGQAYPITATLQSIPPHSGNLAEWTQAGSNKLAAILVLNDVNEINYQARLQVKIEGQGISLTTRANFIPPPITLSFGSPVQLTGSDMSQYFDPNNLNFSGITRQRYFELGGLPDGIYTVCIEVFDFNRSDPGAASQEACSVISAIVHDPPVIINPIGAQVSTYPQNIGVQWQAMHTAAFPTQYQLEIYEWPFASQLAPDRVILSNAPFFETTQMMLTTYLLGPADPPLEMGQRYLVRVRASDITLTNSFRNNGWSELQPFVFGETCSFPDGITVNDVGETTADISWIPNPGFNRYVIRYKEKDLIGAFGYEDESFLDNHTVENLEPGTTYSYQLQAICNDRVAGGFSPLGEFTTTAVDVDTVAYDCSDETTFPQPTNLTPITDLFPGEFLTIGGFRAKVITATKGANGAWNGYAQVKIDWLKQTFFAQFKNLGVNELREVYDGNLVVVSKGLKSMPGFVSPDSIATLRDTAQYDLCGNLPEAINAIDHDPDDGYGDFYATHNQNGFHAPFNPNLPITPDADRFYDPYNPLNGVDNYDPTDYSHPANPYTPANPYDGNSTYNPYNQFNPYDPTDYSDTANPYTADRPYDPQRLSVYATNATFNSGLQTGSITLPYGLTSSGGNGKNYVIAIDGIKISTTGAILNAFISLGIPKRGGGTKYLAFQMKGLKFHPGGLVGEAQMRLAADVSFDMGSKARVTIQKSLRTYVAWDCNGFVGVSMEGKVEFCRDVIVPIDWNTGSVQDSAYATGFFTIASPDWGDFMADITMSPFEIPGLEEWTIFPKNMVIDLSEADTPISVVFPIGYEHPDVTGRVGWENPEWTGFYMKAVRLRLPTRFRKGASENQMSDRQGTRDRSDATGDTPTRSRSSNVLEPPIGGGDSTWIAQVMEIADDPQQIEIGAEDIIIDDTGLTAYIYGSKLLSLEEGRMSSWAFAIDSVGIGIKQNNFVKAFLKGGIKVPAFKTALNYQALISPGAKYAFSVGIRDTVKMDAWRADLELYPNCEINFTYNETRDQYVVGGKFHGRASFKPSTSTSTRSRSNAVTEGPGEVGSGTPESEQLKIPNITFQNFEIMSAAPYVRVGSWALSSGDRNQDKLTGFPLSIQEVGMYQNLTGDEVEFRIAAAVNLVGGGPSGFSARGNIGIISKVDIDTVTGRQTWEFDRVKINKLALNVTGPAFKLRGQVEFYERKAVFGSGFRASIQAEFSPKIAVAALAQFGEVDGYRYWFADALVGFNPGINIGASGMALYGFGGGASYHMKRSNFNNIRLPRGATTALTNASDPSVSTTPDTVAITNAIGISDELGVTLSGSRYIPDRTIGLGIKAMISIGAVRPEAFNGDVVFEINFNTSGGINQIAFSGDLKFLTPPPVPGATTSTAQPAIRARIDMMYDFPNKSFHATLDMFVNVYAGMIKGAYAYPPYLAGTGVIHSDSADWYVYLGTPDQRIMLSMSIPGLKSKDPPATRPRSNAVTDASDGEGGDEGGNSGPTLGDIGLLLTGYMDFGTILPDFPPPPDRVVSILGGGDYNIASRDDPRLANGAGLLFGVGFEASAPDMKFLAFYASFYAGMGFDAMMTDYGTAARCAGNEDSSSPIGINGWLATGQVYAYIEGEVGLAVDIFGITGKYPILSIGAAAILQARLPNPTWMKGTVGGYYDILNGLVSGRCKFDFEFGEKCDIVGANPLAGIKIISSISPDANTPGPLDVFTQPQAAFTIPIGEVFEIPDDSGNPRYFRANLEQFSIMNTDNDVYVPVELIWNTDRDVASLKPTDVIPGELPYKMKVVVGFEKSTDNVSWEILMDEVDNTPLRQSDSITFLTGPAPDYIPHSNVAYSYPLIDQFNYLKAEASQGYIQLKQGQPYLFKGQPEFELEPADWTQKVFFVQNDLIKSQVDITYNSNARRVSYSLPTTQLDNNMVSTIQLMNVPTTLSNIPIDQNVNDIVTDYAANLGANNNPSSGTEATILVKTKEIQGSLRNLEIKEFYTAHFRTSYYDTWTAKVAAHDLDQTWTSPIFLVPGATEGSTINEFGAFFEGVEQLDHYEIKGYFNGTETLPPLVRGDADPSVTGQNWLGEVQTKMYNLLPNANIPMTWRVPGELGVPPLRAIKMTRLGATQVLTDEEVLAGVALPENSQTAIGYQLPYEGLKDYYGFQAPVANYLVTHNNVPQNYLDFMNWTYRQADYGTYRIYLRYYLPGTDTPSSSVSKDIIYGLNNKK